jgi:GTPase Era involved in 16S rRNA processing
MYENKLPYTHCHHCGFELKKGRKLPIHKKHISSLNYQNKIFQTIVDGYIQLGETPVYSFLFFEVFSKLSKLILLNSKHRFIDKHSLFSLVKNAEQNKINHPIFKKIDAKAQSALFGLIMYIFEDFPHNLEAYIKTNKLTYHDLTTKVQEIPFWYETAVNEISPQYLPHSITVTKEEVEHAEQYLKSIGKEINKANLTKLLGCNFASNDNDLRSYI